MELYDYELAFRNGKRKFPWSIFAGFALKVGKIYQFGKMSQDLSQQTSLTQVVNYYSHKSHHKNLYFNSPRTTLTTQNLGQGIYMLCSSSRHIAADNRASTSPL